MKNIIILLLVFVSPIFSVHAQKQHSQPVEFTTTDSLVKLQLNRALAIYYEIKNALVNDNERLAAAKSKEFETALDAVDMKKMTSAERDFFMPLQEKLHYDAQHISKAPNIDHMREHFSPFSNNVWAFVKAFKANNGTTTYQQYCPMQKATWVSKEDEIKNPYYGKQMLSCGKVIETLK